MHEKLLFADSIGALKHHNPIELYDFGPAGYGAWVEDADIQLLEIDSEVDYCDNFTAEIATEFDYTGSREEVATIEDTYQINDASPSLDGDGSGVTGVIMDSGIDTRHSVFTDQLIDSFDATDGNNSKPDSVGHGTGVASLATRIAPGMLLMDLRIFADEGKTSGQVIMRAYEWLVQNRDRYDIVNMSWGAQSDIPQINKIHNKLVEMGIRDVVAAGNTSGKGGSPATAGRAFSVGAIDKNGNMAPFSSYNPNSKNPEVAAIGVNNRLAKAKGVTMGTKLDGPWVMASGTSFSSPIEFGLVARYLSVYPDHTPKQIRSAFIETAADIEGVQDDGHGIAKYKPALSAGKSSEPELETATARIWTFIPGRDSIFLRADWFEPGTYEAINTGDNHVKFTKK